MLEKREQRGSAEKGREGGTRDGGDRQRRAEDVPIPDYVMLDFGLDLDGSPEAKRRAWRVPEAGGDLV